jgi:hypothetical protein
MPVFRLLPKDDYRSLRLPFDTYLPDTVPAEEVKAELAVMEKRFRAGASALGSENSDWERPGSYQHVRVFFVYLFGPAMYCPEFASLIETTMEGFDGKWIGEFECFPIPGTGGWADLVYYKSEFIAGDSGPEKNEEYFHLAKLLGLRVSE